MAIELAGSHELANAVNEAAAARAASRLPIALEGGRPITGLPSLAEAAVAEFIVLAAAVRAIDGRAYARGTTDRAVVVAEEVTGLLLRGDPPQRSPLQGTGKREARALIELLAVLLPNPH